jgi:hypothetical protein
MDEFAADTYSYKPSLLGAPWLFHLAPDALEWQVGRHSGRLRYERITRVSLSFKPATLQSFRFVCEIRSPDAPKLSIVSTTWKSVFEQGRNDDGYTAFVRALHRRLLEARTPAQFAAGSPALLYWPGVAVFAGVTLVLAFMLLRGLQDQSWSAVLVVGGFLALFLWQVGGYFRRNRPRLYTPDAIPPEQLPRP